MPADPTPPRADDHQEREALACPCCGADGAWYSISSGGSASFTAYCTGCKIETPLFGSLAMALDVWNRRVAPEPVREERRWENLRDCDTCNGTGYVPLAQLEALQQGGEGKLRGVLKIARDCIRMHDEGQPVPWAGLARKIDDALAAPAPAAPAGDAIHPDARRDSVECWYCGGNGERGDVQIGDGEEVDSARCFACDGVGRLDLDAVRKLVDDEALDHNTTKDALLRKIEECDALRIQKRQGWVLAADRLPDDPREVLVIADDLRTDYPDGWTTLAWYVDGRWFDGATGKEWAHAERITMWHEIASRPDENAQRAALAAALAAAGK